MRGIARLIVALCCIFALGLVGAQERNDPGGAPATPRMFIVASVAYWDLEKELKSQKVRITAGGFKESEAQEYGSDIRNYTVELLEHSDRIYVNFSLRPFKGVQFFGGIHRYVLDETTAAILERTGEK